MAANKLLRVLGSVLAAAALTVGAVMSAGSAAAAPPPDQTDIVGGSRVSISSVPWTVYLATSSGFQYCGGTLVAPNKVLTAAHCTQGDSPSAVRVVGGREDKNSTAGIVAGVTRIWIHPSYNASTYANDVSVLTLSRSLPYSTLPMATSATAPQYAAGTNARIYGWGTTRSGGSASRYLLGATVPVVSNQSCTNSYGSEYRSGSMICAGYPQGGTDTCQGDSGGPLVAGGRLIGVTSWGFGCAEAGFPGVYARVGALHSAISAEVAR